MDKYIVVMVVFLIVGLPIFFLLMVGLRILQIKIAGKFWETFTKGGFVTYFFDKRP